MTMNLTSVTIVLASDVHAHCKRRRVTGTFYEWENGCERVQINWIWSIFPGSLMCRGSHVCHMYAFPGAPGCQCPQYSSTLSLHRFSRETFIVFIENCVYWKTCLLKPSFVCRCGTKRSQKDCSTCLLSDTQTSLASSTQRLAVVWSIHLGVYCLALEEELPRCFHLTAVFCVGAPILYFESATPGTFVWWVLFTGKCDLILLDLESNTFIFTTLLTNGRMILQPLFEGDQVPVP